MVAGDPVRKLLADGTINVNIITVIGNGSSASP
jgi:hypothetical protein